MGAPMHLERPPATQIACATCGTLFTPKRSWSRFCRTNGDGCRNAFHAAEARREALRDAAPKMYEALKLISATSCERLTTGPGSCWSQPGWSKAAEFGADCWCQPCIALAAIFHLKP